MTTTKGWQASFFNLLKHSAGMWEYWLWQALCAVSFVSERGCLHFEGSRWKLYSICGRIIRWSIVLLMEVENELCSRCIIFYHGSNRNISNIQILTRAVPHAKGVCLLIYEHTYTPVLGGEVLISGIMAFSCAGLQPLEQRFLMRCQRSWWRVYFESLMNIASPKFQLWRPEKPTFFFMEINKRSR